ncbi:MAG: MATE family efflux transporter [Chloroflexi bacterium]|nr:MATE family efflux transporter [Chloroflexota bacterium]MCY4248402.1 MATE family efflux transporter [Chloroflexota bacterium]
MKTTAQPAATHPYLRRPNHTILTLSLPILVSLIAEPVTGLVDTAFVSQLGAQPLAALGVGAGALTSLLWIFSFLGIATQTEVAQTSGRAQHTESSRAVSLALAMGVFASGLLVLGLLPGGSYLAQLLGAEGLVLALSDQYIQMRLLGAPAVIIVFVGFGALRGLQDMRTPLWIALGINIANIALDYLFIFGWAFVPPLGVAGAGLASSLSQWLGALWLLWELHRRLGLSRDFDWHSGLRLLRVGRDLFIRSGALTLFLLVATRVATQMSAEAGAAHQVIRQVWFFAALISEALASSAQSLVGYFFGSARFSTARSVALSCAGWSLATGIVLMLVALAATPLVALVFVPPTAVEVFHFAWIVAALSQPLSGLAFVTDGIHWGTGDYRFLRNVMLMATCCSLLGLALLPTRTDEAFAGVWLAMLLWIGIRAFWGVTRLVPGIGSSPFRHQQPAKS